MITSESVLGSLANRGFDAAATQAGCPCHPVRTACGSGRLIFSINSRLAVKDQPPATAGGSDTAVLTVYRFSPPARNRFR